MGCAFVGPIISSSTASVMGNSTSSMAKRLYDPKMNILINGVRVDFTRNIVATGQLEQRIEPKLAQLLGVLVANQELVIGRGDLIDEIWNGAHGADQSLTNSISQLRKILNEKRNGAVIETIPKRGYRLVAAVTYVDDEQATKNPIESIRSEGERKSESQVSPVSPGKKSIFKIRNATGILLPVGIFIGLAAYAFSDFGMFSSTDSAERISQNPFSKIDQASIAVLPFKNISSDTEQEYFSDGISEEILNALVKVDGLKVASRTSAFTFKNNKDIRIPEIAASLKVRHILEGSVRKSGDEIRITAQLIDAETDQHIWSDVFEESLTAQNIFSIQDKIAAAIVASLGQEMLGADSLLEANIEPYTNNLDAYEAYLEARELFLVRNASNLPRTISLFESAVADDPTFARAWAGLAAAYQIAPTWVLLDRDYSVLASNAAGRAMEINPDLALPYAVLALGATESNPANYSLSFKYFADALEKEPANATIFLWRGISHLSAGFFEPAKEDFKQCLEIDSAYEICRRWWALAKLFEGNIAEALETFELGAEKGERAHVGIFAKAYAAQGDKQGAILTWAWDSRNQNLDFDRFYRAYTDPDFKFDLEGRDFEVEFAVETGNKPSWGTTGGIDHAHTFKRYADLQAYRFYPVWWLRMHEDFLVSPHRKRLIREHGVLAYWKEHDFPPQCRAVGEDDFDCD